MLFGLQICYGIERRILGLPSIQHIYQYRGRIVEIGLNIGVIASIGAIIGCLYRFSDCDFFRSVLNYYIPFWFGIFMVRSRRLYNYITNNQIVYMFILLLFCLTVGLFYSQAAALSGKLIRFLCGMLALPVMFNFFKHHEWTNKTQSIMQYIGQNTLPIYIMQFSLLAGMYNLPPGLNVFCQICLFSILSMLIIVIILFISCFLGHNRYLGQIMLGRKG